LLSARKNNLEFHIDHKTTSAFQLAEVVSFMSSLRLPCFGATKSLKILFTCFRRFI